VVRRFITAWESGDLDAFAALLADDAVFSMPPQPEWFAGREAIREFFGAIWSAMPGQRRLLTIGANGGPAVAVYSPPVTPNAVYAAGGITLLSIRGERISRITRFGSPRLFSLFGLPAYLPSDGLDVR
jgi:RNA polymerase sigma-70 factor (ECF subfamily)